MKHLIGLKLFGNLVLEFGFINPKVVKLNV